MGTEGTFESGGPGEKTFDKALQMNPGNARALYGRGVVKIRRGDGSGNADIAAATTLDRTVADDFTRNGIR